MQCCTWAPHSINGWYLGLALKTYQCYTMWVTNTQAQCICDMLTWLPTKIPMPSASSTDHILAGIADITHALQNPSPNLSLALLTDSQCTALHTLMVVLHGTVPLIAAPTMLPEPPSMQATPLRVPPIITAPTILPEPPITQATPLRVLPTSKTNPLPPATPVPHYIPLDNGSPEALTMSPEPITLPIPTPPSSPALIPPDHDNVIAPTSNCHQH